MFQPDDSHPEGTTGNGPPDFLLLLLLTAKLFVEAEKLLLDIFQIILDLNVLPGTRGAGENSPLLLETEDHVASWIE